MKKFWLFLGAWLLLLIFVNANALSYYGDYLGVPYISWLAETWIILDIILFFIFIIGIIFLKKPHLLQGSFLNKARSIFLIDKNKIQFSLYLALVTFLVGLLATFIKSNHYEQFFALIFFTLSPEYILGSWPFSNWIDTSFGISVFFTTILKWFFIYCVSSFWALRKKNSTSNTEITND